MFFKKEKDDHIKRSIRESVAISIQGCVGAPARDSILKAIGSSAYLSFRNSLKHPVGSSMSNIIILHTFKISDYEFRK
jgi:hypothetical protein